MFQNYLNQINAQGMTEADLIRRIRAVGESHGGPSTKPNEEGQGQAADEEDEEGGSAGAKRKRSKKKKKKKESNERTED